ncbi:MAG TPA: molybdate ABC transporter substrate-binding protein [Vicinamibacterales bacterium]|nr:molybdate ABC transporter substrate-binding protein [Vicinamibacterales bacterium]
MKIKGLTLLVGLVLLFELAQARAANAAQLTILCSNGMKAVMQEITPQFERESGHTVVITYGVSADVNRQIAAGQPFDIVVLTPALIDELIEQRRIAADTRTVLARSPMALAIRGDVPKPDILTTEALKHTLLASRSLAFTEEGASGVFFADLIQRFGLADDLKLKIKLTKTGEEVGRAVARGDAELGVMPVSEILPVHGIEVLGTFPAEVQGYLVMVAGMRADTAQSAAARDWLRFLKAPSTLRVIKKRGMEPG